MPGERQQNIRKVVQAEEHIRYTQKYVTELIDKLNYTDMELSDLVTEFLEHGIDGDYGKHRNIIIPLLSALIMSEQVYEILETARPQI